MDLALLAAISSGAIWGIVPSLYAEASRYGGSVRANFWKSLGAFLFLLPLCYLTGNLIIPPVMGLLFIAANMSLGTGLGDYSFLKAIGLIGPGRATSISFTYVVWTAFLSSFLLGEPLTPLILLGALLAVSGIWVLSYRGGRWKFYGLLWSIIASLSWTLGPIAAKLALNYVSELTMTLWNSLLTTVLYGSLSIPRYRVKGLKKALLGGLLGVGIALPMYFYALNVVGVTIATLATAIGPPTSQLASHISGDRISARDVLGSLLVALGLVLSVIGRT
ncbi:MAG: DMT family transporter [Candidatus Korarchaeota archaeon]|nr:DMT family transporter [Candidatus Korarchaeota archaeon]